MFSFIPNSVLQMSTIFLSIVIEALPFVLLGCLISGALQVFLTPERVKRWLPENRIFSIFTGSILGFFFPSCECGIVPIVHQFVKKGVPVHTAFAFMLTAPIINPIVLFSTYIAFGNRWSVVFYRGGLALAVSVIIGIILSYQFKDNQLLKPDEPGHHHHHHGTLLQKLGGTLRHAIDEFFSVGKYLIIGAFIAAAMQTYVKTSTLLAIGQNDVSSSLVMMGLAFVLSLCSEVDAFIASSFSSTFSLGSLIAFLVFGAMVDIKNLLMMLAAFKKRFVFLLITYIVVIVLAGSLLVKG